MFICLWSVLEGDAFCIIGMQFKHALSCFIGGVKMIQVQMGTITKGGKNYIKDDSGGSEVPYIKGSYMLDSCNQCVGTCEIQRAGWYNDE